MCNYQLVSARALASNTAKNTPTHETHVCTHAHDYLMLPQHPCCAFVTVKQGQGHEGITFSFPASSRQDPEGLHVEKCLSKHGHKYCKERENEDQLGMWTDHSKCSSRLLCGGGTLEINRRLPTHWLHYKTVKC